MRATEAVLRVGSFYRLCKVDLADTPPAFRSAFENLMKVVEGPLDGLMDDLEKALEPIARKHRKPFPPSQN